MFRLSFCLSVFLSVHRLFDCHNFSLFVFYALSFFVKNFSPVEHHLYNLYPGTNNHFVERETGIDNHYHFINCKSPT